MVPPQGEDVPLPEDRPVVDDRRATSDEAPAPMADGEGEAKVAEEGEQGAVESMGKTEEVAEGDGGDASAAPDAAGPGFGALTVKTQAEPVPGVQGAVIPSASASACGVVPGEAGGQVDSQPVQEAPGPSGAPAAESGGGTPTHEEAQRSEDAGHGDPSSGCLPRAAEEASQGKGEAVPEAERVAAPEHRAAEGASAAAVAFESGGEEARGGVAAGGEEGSEGMVAEVGDAAQDHHDGAPQTEVALSGIASPQIEAAGAKEGAEQPQEQTDPSDTTLASTTPTTPQEGEGLRPGGPHEATLSGGDADMEGSSSGVAGCEGTSVSAGDTDLRRSAPSSPLVSTTDSGLQGEGAPQAPSSTAPASAFGGRSEESGGCAAVGVVPESVPVTMPESAPAVEASVVGGTGEVPCQDAAADDMPVPAAAANEAPKAAEQRSSLEISGVSEEAEARPGGLAEAAPCLGGGDPNMEGSDILHERGGQEAMDVDACSDAASEESPQQEGAGAKVEDEAPAADRSSQGEVSDGAVPEGAPVLEDAGEAPSEAQAAPNDAAEPALVAMHDATADHVPVPAAAASEAPKAVEQRNSLEILRLIDGVDDKSGETASGSGETDSGGIKRSQSEAESPSQPNVVDGAQTVCTNKRIKLTPATSSVHSRKAEQASSFLPTLDLKNVNLLLVETFKQGQSMQALRIFRALRVTGIVPDKAMYDMFEAALSLPSQDVFLQEFGTEIIDLAGSPFLASMPPELPISVALAAVSTSQYKTALLLFDSLFARDRRSSTALAPPLRTDEVIDGYLRSCLEQKVSPMRLEELLTLSLLPSSLNSHLWSLAVSVYALTNEPKEAFDLVEYVESHPVATPSVAAEKVITMEADADACASAVSNGLVYPLCTRRLEALLDKNLLTLPFCHLMLESIMRQGAGRLDMSAWHEVLKVLVKHGLELDEQVHRLTLHAAVSSRDVASARLALNDLHGCDAEADDEVEKAVWVLEERERKKNESKSMLREAAQMGEESEEVALNKANLTGKNEETYLRFCCKAIRFRRPDVACEGWTLLLERCGTKVGQELVETLFCTLCDAGFPSEAIAVAQSLVNSLSLKASSDSPATTPEPVCLSHDALTMSLRSAVTAPRQSLPSARTEAIEQRSRVEIVEQTLDLARASQQSNQVLYTNAVQALEALSGDGFATPGSGDWMGGLELLTCCHERMRADGIVPSPEAYEVFITAAGFAMRDPELVRKLTDEMKHKAGMAPTPAAREALCAALAQEDPDAAAQELEGMKADSVFASQRCVKTVVEGLVASGQPAEALQLAKSLGCGGEDVKMVLLKGFVACGELDKAFELFGAFHESGSMPRKFQDFVKVLAGGAIEEDAELDGPSVGAEPAELEMEEKAGA